MNRNYDNIGIRFIYKFYMHIDKSYDKLLFICSQPFTTNKRVLFKIGAFEGEAFFACNTT